MTKTTGVKLSVDLDEWDIHVLISGLRERQGAASARLFYEWKRAGGNRTNPYITLGDLMARPVVFSEYVELLRRDYFRGEELLDRLEKIERTMEKLSKKGESNE